MAPAALRLLFHYEADPGSLPRLELRAALPVSVRLPPPHPTGNDLGATTGWFELQDGDRRVLYRRLMRLPTGAFLEVPTSDPNSPFRYRETDQASAGAFSILVPDRDAGSHVELFGNARGLVDDPVRSLGRFELSSVSREALPPEPPR